MRVCRALTLLELLIVVSVIALLIAILTPEVTRNRAAAKRAACSSNLRSQVIAFESFASANADQYPKTKIPLASVCDQGVDVRNAIVAASALPAGNEKVFYCPGNSAQDSATLWTVGARSVWGYIWLNDRGSGGAALPASFPPRKVPLQFLDSPPKKHTSEVILAADAILTDRDSAPFNFSPRTAIPFGTNHVATGFTTASMNVGFPDGHVEYKKFDAAKSLPAKQPGGWFWFPAD